MTAVTKCYPGRSLSGKGDRVPSRHEQQLCRQFLDREISIISPKLIILVGGLAIKLFYPPAKRLVDVIGKAVYLPPESISDPLSFSLADSIPLEEVVEAPPEDGTVLVPLPHPSGASLWPNKPENKRLIQDAIRILGDIRTSWKL
jgi:uracil-DNA glycosylase